MSHRSETGITWGDPGNAGGAGRPVPRAGAWPRRTARGASKARQLASRCGEAGRGPSISYMEGPRLILPRRSVLCQDRHAAAAGTPAAMTQVTADLAVGRRSGHLAHGHVFPGLPGPPGLRRTVTCPAPDRHQALRAGSCGYPGSASLRLPARCGTGYLGKRKDELQMANWLHNTEHSAPAVAVFSG